MRTLPRLAACSPVPLVALLGLFALGLPSRAAAQPAGTPADDIYSAMPPPAAPYQPGSPAGAAPSPYGQGQGAPPAYADDDVGYVDAGAEAAAQVQSESDAGYVDDGWDADAYTDYEAALNPYGSWVNTADYGRVWAPSSGYVGADFMPYVSGGHWVLTEFGWTWVSDWDWGWAPFHYGRWFLAGNYGWCWRPGRVWGPAWVSWRSGGGYVGWTPLPPRGISIPAPPPAGSHGAWRFTTVAGLSAPRPAFVPAAQTSAAWSSTTPIRNVQTINAYRVEAGPHPSAVAATLGHPVQPAPIHTLPGAAPRATIVPRTPPIAATWGYRQPGGLLGGATSAPSAHAPTLGGPGFRAATPAPSSGSSSPWHAATPSYATPSYRPAPSYAAPAYAAPSYAAPSSSAPTYRSAPSYSPPAAQAAPSYSQPAYRPSYSGPSYGVPSYSPPAYRPAPAYSPPIYHSVPSYSPPSYAAPSYSAPSPRPAPSFSAPSYSAPSYSAPSYSAPSFRAAPPAAAAPRPSFSAPPRPSAGRR